MGSAMEKKSLPMGMVPILFSCGAALEAIRYSFLLCFKKTGGTGGKSRA